MRAAQKMEAYFALYKIYTRAFCYFVSEVFFFFFFLFLPTIFSIFLLSAIRASAHICLYIFATAAISCPPTTTTSHHDGATMFTHIITQYYASHGVQARCALTRAGMVTQRRGDDVAGRGEAPVCCHLPLFA